MGVEGIGSSVVIALAAVLWLAYLVPTWFRRREYLSTERNAVRLQQTIRILAETAEVPEAVRLESTARDVAQQQRLLRQQFERDRAVARAREAEMGRAAAATLATLKPSIAAHVVAHSADARRLRRARAATTAVLLAAVATAVASVTPVLASVGTSLLIMSAAVGGVCVLLLSRMASVARTRAELVSELRSRPAPERRTATAEVVAPPEESRSAEWTPVPLPKPLYLSKPPVQPVVSDAVIAETRERLLAEAARAETAALAAERAEKVTPIRHAPAAASRFARMGIIDEAENTVTDLDAVLRRRRAV